MILRTLCLLLLSVSTVLADAKVTFRALNDSTVSGTLVLKEVEEGISIKGTIKNLTPGMHGFHVHEKGDCSASDGSSAGGHFTIPDHPRHGAKTDLERHIGDLGNIEATAAGVAEVDIVDDKISLKGATSVLDRAMIVHAGSDDLKSQPSGAAGARIACGLIEAE